MTAMFDDLMNGLSEVDAFLGGKTAGYSVSVPAQVVYRAVTKKAR